MSKYLIIGGVAGGASAAARLRRLDEKAEIVLVERGEYVSYANCGLPYYAGGVIQDREKLFVMTPQKFQETLAVDVRTNTEAVAIDVAGKTVTLLDRISGQTSVETCDGLILSPGAEPLRPPIPGIDHPLILTLRSVPDIDRIKKVLDDGSASSTHRPMTAVVVGGGFIGLEMAENLRHRGLAVTVVEALDQVMNVVDFEMAAIVHHHLRDKGIGLYLGDGVKEFEHQGDAVSVNLKSGTKLPADLVILSIGVKPDTKLARESGIVLDERGCIVVDPHLRTNVAWIYAVGDAVVSKSPLTGKSQSVPLAGPANKQARIAAENLVRGDSRTWNGALGTAVAKVFDLTVATTGLSEKACKREKIPYMTAIVHPGSHANYYPGSHPYSLKLLWSPQSGKILGAQAVGIDGVDKRIDVIAAHLGMEAVVRDLAEFEHAYAPSYSSAKDGVNYVGFVAVDALEGLTDIVRWDEVESKVADGAMLLDVRSVEEFELGHIPGAVNIPNTEIRRKLAEIPKDRLVLLYCGVGIRGYLAERIMRQNGYENVANLTGGWKTWKAATDPQENREPTSSAVVRFPASELVVDTCGLQCPGPILRLKEAVDEAPSFARIIVKASDPGFGRDAQAWCNITGHNLVSMREEHGNWIATIEKLPHSVPATVSQIPFRAMTVSGNEVTLIVFSNDLDRALASFVIANGALATGKKVTMFFTFWGLSVIRKREKASVPKDMMGRMFDLMLPRSAKGLGLSRMNFGGIGAMLMKRRMEALQVDKLESMMESALRAGVRMTACQMSMDLMGVAREELMDGVEQGGVASYLEAAGTAGINLFV